MRTTLVIASLLAFGVSPVLADDVNITVIGSDGKPVEGAVITLNSPAASALPTDQKQAIMDQVDKQFTPHVLVVQKNTEVAFPNSDSIRHHVYSFSPAKRFELKLYKEFEAKPVTFEESGLVEIGCNIHDWMVGYIFVADSPYFAKTGIDGVATIDVPSDDYEITFWHPAASFEDNEKAYSLKASEKMKTIQLEDELIEGLDFSTGFEEY